jgi:hypothetical protein
MKSLDEEMVEKFKQTYGEFEDIEFEQQDSTPFDKRRRLDGPITSKQQATEDGKMTSSTPITSQCLSLSSVNSPSSPEIDSNEKLDDSSRQDQTRKRKYQQEDLDYPVQDCAAPKLGGGGAAHTRDSDVSNDSDLEIQNKYQRPEAGGSKGREKIKVKKLKVSRLFNFSFL